MIAEWMIKKFSLSEAVEASLCYFLKTSFNKQNVITSGI
jgi:hypothetical protein